MSPYLTHGQSSWRGARFPLPHCGKGTFFTMSVWWLKRGLYCCWSGEAGLRCHAEVSHSFRYDSESLVLNAKAQYNGE